jgi:signal transduction histidine kinase
VDALIRLNSALAGFFAFAAIHYAMYWWLSRRERVLLVFSIQCAIYTIFCLAFASYLRAKTISDTQTALDRFVSIGAICHAVVLQFYWYLGRRRDRAFRALVTGVITFLAVLNQWVPLRGTVIELQTIRLPGGSTGWVPIRTPPGAPLAILYAAVLAAHAYGFVAARTIWKSDRVGATLIAAGSAAVLAGAVLGLLVDFANVRAPYAGAWPHVIFVLSVALFLSREYSARGAQLVASESRLQSSLRETQEALAALQTEQRKREEADRARQEALQAFVQAQKAEIASQLAAGAAHDFNNVLGLISVWSGVMLNDSRSASEAEAARLALAEAERQGKSLTRQLVALLQPEARSVTRFPLVPLIHATVQTLTPALPPGTSLRFEASHAPEIEADEGEIQQVIYNLVLNAGDAMPDGGMIEIKAGLETSPSPIAVVGGSLGAGLWATLTVSDSGPGIEPAIRERIFDMFFTTKGAGRGTGLGLATVMRIAKISGGGIALDTEPGRGTTFRLYLPCAGASGSADVPTPDVVQQGEPSACLS